MASPDRKIAPGSSSWLDHLSYFTLSTPVSLLPYVQTHWSTEGHLSLTPAVRKSFHKTCSSPYDGKFRGSSTTYLARFQLLGKEKFLEGFRRLSI